MADSSLFHADERFLVVDQEASWWNAKEKCSQQNGYLLEVKTQEDHDRARKFRIDIDKDIWLGGNDINQEGNWIWDSEGDQMDMGRFWDDGEPNGDDGNDCLVIKKEGRFRSNECSKEHYFVCELN